MQYCTNRSRFAYLTLVLGCAMAGCGMGYPYYTLGGSPESRVVVIHIDKETTEEVPVGTGIGGGLSAEHKAALAMGEEAVVEKGKARVTVTAKGPMGAVVTIKNVEYDGKKVLYHEPIL